MKIYVYYEDIIKGGSFVKCIRNSGITPEIIDVGFPKYKDTVLQKKELSTLDSVRIFILPRGKPDALFKYYINSAYDPIIIKPSLFSQDKFRISLYKQRINMSNKNNQFHNFCNSLY